MSDADADNRSELVDDEVIGPEYPSDEPVAVDDYGTTAAEQRVPEPLDERVEREEPDTPPPAPATSEEAAERSRSEEDDFIGDETTRDVATEREAPKPAEEAAMHEIVAPEDQEETW